MAQDQFIQLAVNFLTKQYLSDRKQLLPLLLPEIVDQLSWLSSFVAELGDNFPHKDILFRQFSQHWGKNSYWLIWQNFAEYIKKAATSYTQYQGALNKAHIAEQIYQARVRSGGFSDFSAEEKGLWILRPSDYEHMTESEALEYEKHNEEIWHHLNKIDVEIQHQSNSDFDIELYIQRQLGEKDFFYYHRLQEVYKKLLVDRSDRELLEQVKIKMLAIKADTAGWREFVEVGLAKMAKWHALKIYGQDCLVLDGYLCTIEYIYLQACCYIYLLAEGLGVKDLLPKMSEELLAIKN